MTAKKADTVLSSVLIWVPPEAEPKIRIPVQVINWGGDPMTPHPVGSGRNGTGKKPIKSEYQASNYAGDRSLMLLGHSIKHGECASQGHPG